jgi:hypothetical protein
MADSFVLFAGYGGMIGALLWLGIKPYLEKRKEAELAGEPIPSFAGAYMTTFIISFIAGFFTTTMVITQLEQTLAGVGSVMYAAGIGFSFTFTVLGISNQTVDKKLEASKLRALKKRGEDLPT